MADKEFQEGVIVEYDRKNWLVDAGQVWLARYESDYSKDQATVGYNDVVVLSHHPDDNAELARLLGIDETLIGFKVTFNNSVDAGNIWDVGSKWNMYCRKYSLGRSTDVVDRVSFTKRNSRVNVSFGSAFYEYTWEEVIEGCLAEIKDCIRV